MGLKDEQNKISFSSLELYNNSRQIFREPPGKLHTASPSAIGCFSISIPSLGPPLVHMKKVFYLSFIILFAFYNFNKFYQMYIFI